jgi:hypothetical protein
VEDERVIDGTQLLRIEGNDVQLPLPREQRNRDIDRVGVIRPAAQQADSAGDRVIDGDDLRALIDEQGGESSSH